MAGLKEIYCGSNEPSHASQFKWLEYTFKLWFYNTFWFYFSATRTERPQRCTERHPPAVPTMLITELTPAVSFF